MDSDRSSVISSIIASICIVLYITAIAFGVIKIVVDMSDRRSIAEQEFNDLADRSSSAAILGFMSEAYQESIRDALNDSRTLLGVIISGPEGEYAFERYPGSVVAWAEKSPRFKTGFGLPGTPLYQSLRLNGQRNGNIQGSYSYINYDDFIDTLRNTLVVVLIVLSAAVLTLILETAIRSRSPEYQTGDQGTSRPAVVPSSAAAPRQKVPAVPEPETEGDPKGLFSPRGNIGWESYTQDRLESELHRCASFEQDLVFIMMEFKDGKLDDSLYKIFAEEAVNFFTLRDLIFEKGDQGIAVIAPNIDLEQGFLKSEEFRERILKKLPDSSKTGSELCTGLSSRSGRLIEAERLMFETSQALLKALADPLSPIVAFKSDPEKYRDFISRTR
jgi:multisubunit Na+/H+ antiporter MnhC subunit